MRFSQDDLIAAARAGLIAPDQLKPLLIFLDARAPSAAAAAGTTPKFDMVHMLWYTGALIVIGDRKEDRHDRPDRAEQQRVDDGAADAAQ